MAAPPVVPALSTDRNVTFLRLCGLLRDIRAEAQDLQSAVVNVRQKAALADQQTRAREILASQAASNQVLERNRVQIQARLVQVRDLFQVDAAQYDWCGDEVTSIENYWAHTLDTWPQPDLPPDDVLRAAAKADECLEQVIYLCASLTITRRLGDMLANLRVGQPLDFHHAFEDEFPDDIKELGAFLKELGAAKSFEPVERREEEGERVRRYRLTAQHGSVLVTFRLSKDGKIARLGASTE
jgi:hypothetical protein